MYIPSTIMFFRSIHFLKFRGELFNLIHFITKPTRLNNESFHALSQKSHVMLKLFKSSFFFVKGRNLIIISEYILHIVVKCSMEKNWFYKLGHERVNKRVHFIMTIIKLFSKITFFTAYLLKFKPQNKPDYCFCLVPRYINLGRKNSIKVTLFFAWNSYQPPGFLFGLKIPKESMKKILKT